MCKGERIRDVLDRSLDLLDSIIAEIEAHKYPPDILEAYVQRHANSIAHLAHDALLLIDSGHFAGPPLLVRGMMESAFILVAATKDRAFVEEKLLGEITDWRRRAIKALAHADPPQSASFPELDKLEAIVRADYGLKGRKFRVEDIAKIAELEVHYAFEYFYYSQHTHAELGGLIGRHFSEDLPVLNLKTMTHLILLATCHTPQLLKTHTPQLHVDASTKLLNELLSALTEDSSTT